jgi:phage tail-like protein
MALTDTSKIGLANRFVVSMSGKSEYDLGSWAKAEGLDVAWDIAEYRMGDGGNDRLYFPGNTKYQNVKLIRGVSEETEKVKQWLSRNSWEMEVFSGKITLFTTQAIKVTDWELRDVLPAKWSISTFDAGASSVSMETLELVHRGFLEDETILPKA